MFCVSFSIFFIFMVQVNLLSFPNRRHVNLLQLLYSYRVSREHYRFLESQRFVHMICDNIYKNYPKLVTWNDHITWQVVRLLDVVEFCSHLHGNAIHVLDSENWQAKKVRFL